MSFVCCNEPCVISVEMCWYQQLIISINNHQLPSNINNNCQRLISLMIINKYENINNINDHELSTSDNMGWPPGRRLSIHIFPLFCRKNIGFSCKIFGFSCVYLPSEKMDNMPIWPAMPTTSRLLLLLLLLLTTDYWLLTTDYWLLTTDYWLLTTDYWLLTTDYWLLTTDYWLLTTDYWLLTTDYWLLATDYWLLTTDYYWLLLTNYWLTTD